MKAKYKLRKQFQQVLNSLSIKNEATMQTLRNKITGQPYERLFNAQKTVIRSMMELSVEKQLAAIEQLKLEAARREVDNQALVSG